MFSMSQGDVYADLAGLRTAFESGNISAQDVIAQLSDANIQKPWHGENWLRQRKTLILDRCTQCRSDEGPFVLQHLWQPAKLSHIIQEVRRPYLNTYHQTHPYIEIPQPSPEGEYRDACPKCGGLSINWRKTKESWRCGKPGCNFEFETPVKRRMLTHNQYEQWHNAYKMNKQQWYNTFAKEMDETVMAEALRIAFEQHDRYMSMKDTTTFCKKCAFMWDIKQRKLCEGCKTYVPFYVTPETCFTCNDSWFDPPDIDELYDL